MGISSFWKFITSWIDTHRQAALCREVKVSFYKGASVDAASSDVQPDWLYVDVNNMLYTSSRRAPTKRAMVIRVMSELDAVLTWARPRRGIFLAMDGAAPRAKMLTQIQRRQGLDRKGVMSAIAALVEEAEAKGVDHVRRGSLDVGGAASNSDDGSVDPLHFCAGTVFMQHLKDALSLWVLQRLSQAPWAQLEAIVSGADTAGEGEFKIFAHLHQLAAKDPNDQLSAIVVGSDSDLIAFGMMCPLNVRVHVLRRMRGATCMLYDATGFRKAMVKSVRVPAGVALSPDHELRMGTDFVTLCAMSGTDYLDSPLGIASLSAAWSAYTRLWKRLPKGCTELPHLVDRETGRVHWPAMRHILALKGSMPSAEPSVVGPRSVLQLLASVTGAQSDLVFTVDDGNDVTHKDGKTLVSIHWKGTLLGEARARNHRRATHSASLSALAPDTAIMKRVRALAAVEVELGFGPGATVQGPATSALESVDQLQEDLNRGHAGIPSPLPFRVADQVDPDTERNVNQAFWHMIFWTLRYFGGHCSDWSLCVDPTMRTTASSLGRSELETPANGFGHRTTMNAGNGGDRFPPSPLLFGLALLPSTHLHYLPPDVVKASPDDALWALAERIMQQPATGAGGKEATGPKDALSPHARLAILLPQGAAELERRRDKLVPMARHLAHSQPPLLFTRQRVLGVPPSYGSVRLSSDEVLDRFGAAASHAAKQAHGRQRRPRSTWSGLVCVSLNPEEPADALGGGSTWEERLANAYMPNPSVVPPLPFASPPTPSASPLRVAATQRSRKRAQRRAAPSSPPRTAFHTHASPERRLCERYTSFVAFTQQRPRVVPRRFLASLRMVRRWCSLLPR